MSTESTDSSPSTATEEWVYLGPHSKPKRFLWRDPSGSTLVYEGVRGRVFGGIYTFEVTRFEGHIQIVPNPVYTGRHAEDAAGIEALAVEAETLAAAKRLEANTARTSKVDALIADLLVEAAKLKTESERYALARLVSNRIIGAR